MINTIFSFLAFILIFSGCSSKKYYKPKNTISHTMKVKDLNTDILSISSNGATLKNFKFISKSGISKIALEKGYEFINDVNGTILASNDAGSLYVKKDSKIEHYQFDKKVIAASIRKTSLALLFVDNSIALYDTVKRNITFKEYYTTSELNDINIASPIFLSSVVLCPTLDGKIIVINFESNKVVQTINIDPQSKINNIIFFNTIDDTLIAATSKKLFLFSNGKVKTKELNIKDVVISKSNIFVATLDGELIKYDHLLNKIKSKKYKFAKFYTIGHTKYLYALESQGFIVRLNDDFKEEKVFKFSFDEDEEATIINNTLYFEDNYVQLK